MYAQLDQSTSTSIQQLVGAMESAWNTGDGAAFAEAFAEDADFVNVYGMHARGRSAIAAGHNFIFTTIYKGSTVEYRIDSMRELVPEVTLVHVSAKLTVPAGPMAGTHEAVWSGVTMLTSDGWKFAAFQNTFVKAPPKP